MNRLDQLSSDVIQASERADRLAKDLKKAKVEVRELKRVQALDRTRIRFTCPVCLSRQVLRGGGGDPGGLEAKGQLASFSEDRTYRDDSLNMDGQFVGHCDRGHEVTLNFTSRGRGLVWV